jgi:hypothetical protein
MLNWWKECIIEALPLQYILPLVIILGSLCFLGDYVYSFYIDSKEIVVEVIDDIAHSDYASWKDVADDPLQVTEAVFTINQETGRVLRI